MTRSVIVHSPGLHLLPVMRGGAPVVHSLQLAICLEGDGHLLVRFGHHLVLVVDLLLVSDGLPVVIVLVSDCPHLLLGVPLMDVPHPLLTGLLPLMVGDDSPVVGDCCLPGLYSAIHGHMT